MLELESACLSEVVVALCRLIGSTLWFHHALCFMYAYYSVVECSCGVGSNASVVLTLYVTCYTIRLVVVVHFIDEGECPNFDFLRSWT